jgi:hypothetical protein
MASKLSSDGARPTVSYANYLPGTLNINGFTKVKHDNATRHLASQSLYPVKNLINKDVKTDWEPGTSHPNLSIP